ncbi:NADPH-dependent oxidoreductase [Paenibacillus thalictri]|nr:NADPH-dependent oxidoreductase [Paenibacillus thalictri]
MNDVIKTIQQHRSIRKFKNTPLTQEQIDTIVRAAQMAPTSGHFQAYSIIGVTDAGVKKELSKRSGNPVIETCGYLFIFCADLYRIMTAASDNEKQQMKNNVSFAYFNQTSVTDTALAMQNANLAAESMGLGTVIIGGINGALPDLDRWLDLPEYVIPLAGLAVGVPDEHPEQKLRLPQSAVFFENKYNHQLKASVASYDKEMELYYEQRTNNKQKSNWSQKVIHMLTSDIPIEFYTDYIKSKGFALK